MVRRYIVLDYLSVVAIVIGCAFWGGLLLDYGPILLGGLEMPRSARVVLLLSVGVFVTFITVRSLHERLSRELPDESLALLIEKHHPELGERLMTSVQLASNRPGDSTYSRSLFESVRREAAELSDNIDIQRVFNWKPLIQKGGIALVMLAGVIIFGIAKPSGLSLAMKRLLLATDDPWPRRSSLEMVGVEVPIISFSDSDDSSPQETRLIEFVDKELRLARGGSATLRIRAKAEDSVVPEVCTVRYVSESGNRGQANMRRVGRVRDGYQYFALDGPPLDGISEDVMLTIVGLDDRLADFSVIAVDPPGITDLTLDCYYPQYLREPGNGSKQPDRIVGFAPGLRIKEGTNLDIVGESTKPLSEVAIKLKGSNDDSEILTADIDPDGIHFRISLNDFREPQTLMILPVDKVSISAAAPFRYFLGVLKDQPPEVNLNLLGIGGAITPFAKIPFQGSAKDDYELKRTELALTSATNENAPPVLRNIEVRAEDDTYKSLVDLRELSSNDTMATLKPGERLNLFAEASDRYDLGADHTTRSDLYGLDVVTPDQLLGRLERRELGLRGRLEQSIGEIRQLRDVLNRVSKDDWQRKSVPESATANLQGQDNIERAEALRVLRIQQSSLQASKTREEVTGIAAALGDIILEMENNRVDSVDRRDRISLKVKAPLEMLVEDGLLELQRRIDNLSLVAKNPETGPQVAANAVEQAEEVLLQLEAILESMLDLESYNEILDYLRDLIDREEKLIEDTKEEQKNSFLDLLQLE